MKKTIFILGITLLISIILYSEPITIEDAHQVADTYLKLKHEESKYSISMTFAIKGNDDILSYIFDLKPIGFIAISSDNNITPIIAYSFRNNLVRDEENLLYYMLKKDMEFRLEAMDLFPSEKIQHNNTLWQEYISEEILETGNRDFQQWPEPGSTSTSGWIETTWNQSYPYNMFCPLDNSGQRSIVGCTATAMAQIVNFHEYIGNASFSDTDDYTTWSQGIHIDDDHEERDFPSFPELNVYLDTLRYHYENSMVLTNEDKATLSFACGVSVEMDYSSSGSGAWPVPEAFINKFGFDSAHWMNYDEWGFYDSLCTDMMNARPAELCIYTSGWNNGHAIVSDGYNTDDFYHLNFGWGATQPNLIITAWYSLPQGMPAGYCIVYCAVLNIEGGDRPLTVSGIVYTDEVNPTGTTINFQGDHSYSTTVEDSNGFYEIPTVFPGYYTASAFLGRLYYQTKEVYIDSAHTVVDFNLFNYESVTGVVSVEGGADPTGAIINFVGDYNYSTVVDNLNGEYEILDVMPGHYTATANLNRI
ncbi:hypothetical protein DRP43_04715, partial [candidate division TA06 bacterium]